MYDVPFFSGLILVLLRREAYGFGASVRVAVSEARDDTVVDSGVGLAGFGVGDICRRACAEYNWGGYRAKKFRSRTGKVSSRPVAAC